MNREQLEAAIAEDEKQIRIRKIWLKNEDTDPQIRKAHEAAIITIERLKAEAERELRSLD